jgi:hypothetical protein
VLKPLEALYIAGTRVERGKGLWVHTVLQVNVFLQLTVKPAITREVRLGKMK